MTKEQILNICKRIEENKATEEELCAIRDVALARSETVPVLRQVGQVHHAMANDGKCGPYFWTESIAALPDGTPLYVKNAAPQSSPETDTAATHRNKAAESASLDPSVAVVNSGLDVLEWKDTQRCVAVPILSPTRDDGSAAPHGE